MSKSVRVINRNSREFVPVIRGSVSLLTDKERAELNKSIENISVFIDRAAPRRHYQRVVDLTANDPIYVPFPTHQGFEIEHLSGANIEVASENADTSFVAWLNAGVTRTRDNDVTPGLWFRSTGAASFFLSTW